ncbi:methyltransferase [Thorsellia kenyensis]|uniref:Ribosomal RNA small subunit methyltransferase C n=1 Tax=Thorsellia kenyensis TaxID=1549888 RepID=A0ABV6CCX4_9GAMM
MKTMSLASQILERHSDLLTQHNLLFAGDIQDNYAAKFPHAKVLTSQFHHHIRLLKSKINSTFGTIFDEKEISGSTLLVYYWPKSKDEAIFQLTQLLSISHEGLEILIVGENRIGVRSIENRFDDLLSWQKIDTAKRCSLYYAKIKSIPLFIVDHFWFTYFLNDKIKHHALPGVFSRQHLDLGTDLLIHSFKNKKNALKSHKPSYPLKFLSQPKMSADILDLCSGAGVMTLALHELFPNLKWTLADSQAQAITSALHNLSFIDTQATVIASDLFSEVTGKFDMIIANPPFHDGKQTDYSLTESLIKNAPLYLRAEGALRIVANGFLPYEEIMFSVFNNVEILEKNTKFIIYQSIKLSK